MTSSGRPTVEVDELAEVAYVNLGEERDVTRTVEFAPGINVDLDAYGMALGIEVLSFSLTIPWDQIVKQYHVRSSVVDAVRRVAPTMGTFVRSFGSPVPVGGGAPNVHRNNFLPGLRMPA